MRYSFCVTVHPPRPALPRPAPGTGYITVRAVRVATWRDVTSDAHYKCRRVACGGQFPATHRHRRTSHPAKTHPRK
ncbi:hypothetical protein O3P69_001031 [Scylla paramamosain]|uniref:C2H2-type domain-containing protein n=1 Tax=Scylla paramamosain TaxID=85552 RepID=A0AAW0USH2_SCYPA